MIRKIENEAEKRKKQRKNQILIGGILVGLMILSTAGFAIMSYEGNTNTGRVKERGFEFIQQNSFWVLDYGSHRLIFTYLPSEVSDVEIQGEVSLAEYTQKTLYFTSSDSSIIQTISNIQPYLLRYQDACLEGRVCENNELPIKTCEDNVLIPVPGDEKTRVLVKEKCVYFEGETLKAADAFVYRLYGII